MSLIETIFDDNAILDDEYPTLAGVKTFDLERKHLLYGKIDTNGNAVYLDDRNLKQLSGGKAKTDYAVDFVCDAFDDLKKNVRSAANKNQISTNSLYKPEMNIYRAYGAGDLEYFYNQYINNIYTTFVDVYLGTERKHESVKNYKDFVKEFVRFSLEKATSFPITRTGYITSVHCSPFVSGLMLEIAPVEHGPGSVDRALDYINDPNFIFFVNEVKKFGFMVDKAAPWRIVFNLASGMLDKQTNEKDTGGQFYMKKQNVHYENVFQNHYRKAHLDELLNIKNVLHSLYQSFYEQFSTYEKITYATKNDGSCTAIKIKTNRLDRESPPEPDDESLASSEYWLKVLLKLRMAETNYPHDVQNFNSFVKKMTDLRRLLGEESALEYINNLTKGFHVTKFTTRGSYWYGLSEDEYREKLLLANSHANDPTIADYSLTGTKNIK